MFGQPKVKNLTPRDVHAALQEDRIVLVDVREPHEHAAERIEGAVLAPLSSFDPAALPSIEGKALVMQCGSGMRSAKAVAQCQKAGLAVDSHLEGGIMAWKAAGLPTAR